MNTKDNNFVKWIEKNTIRKTLLWVIHNEPSKDEIQDILNKMDLEDSLRLFEELNLS